MLLNASSATDDITAFLSCTSFWAFFMNFPKKPANTTTGTIQASISKVSCQDITNRKMIAAIMKIKERRNMETLVDRPSVITVVSVLSLLTIDQKGLASGGSSRSTYRDHLIS